MTHSEIYTKFMIEYDKANVTSSYPSLTKYEIATILDKAYLAMIAEKYTGNNPRQVPLEGDLKAIEDLRPLICISDIIGVTPGNLAENDCMFTIPSDFLYYIKSTFEYISEYSAIDTNKHNIAPVTIVNHEIAAKFMASTYNLPWIKEPVGVFEQNTIHVLYDVYEYNKTPGSFILHLRYIKKPNKFVIADQTATTFELAPDTIFELSDTMAEELINLAIILAAETVESPRMTTKTNLRPLEA